MLDQVEVDLQHAAAGRVDRRSAEPMRIHVKRHLPAVIDPRCQRQPHLADDLRPQLKRGGRLAPRRITQWRPGLDRAHRGPPGTGAKKLYADTAKIARSPGESELNNSTVEHRTQRDSAEPALAQRHFR